MISASLIIFTLVVLIVTFLVRWWKFLSLASKIPGHKGQIPMVGILPKFIGANEEKTFEIYDNYSQSSETLIKFWIGPEFFVSVTNPELLKKVFNSNECLDKPNFFKFINAKNSLVFGSLNAWKRHRKILNSSFTYEILKNFVSTFDEKSKSLIKILNEEKCNQNEFDVFSYMSIFFSETILSSGFDFDIDIQTSGKRDEFVKNFDE